MGTYVNFGARVAGGAGRAIRRDVGSRCLARQLRYRQVLSPSSFAAAGSFVVEDTTLAVLVSRGFPRPGGCAAAVAAALLSGLACETSPGARNGRA